MIRELGLLDEHLDRHHAEFGRPVRDDQRGVAYPSVFLLDAGGMVVRKRAHRNYRIRDTGAGLVEEMLGGTASAHGVEAAADDEVVRIRAYLDSPTYRWYQRLRVVVDVAVQDGYHIYGTPIPEGYVPLSAAIDPIDGLEAGRIIFDAHQEERIAGLKEMLDEGTKSGQFHGYHSQLVAEVMILAAKRLREPSFLAKSGLTFSQALEELSRLLRFGLTSKGPK